MNKEQLPARPTVKEPPRIRRLARDSIGRPVPWFVQWFDGDVGGDYGVGKPDFRIVDERKIVKALREDRCFICGVRFTGPSRTFAIGPMCVVNRISAEPPSHYECALHAARVCPWILNPNKDRRDTAMPEGRRSPVGMIERNPGVFVLWRTRSYQPFQVQRTVLIEIGPPSHIDWYAQGRPASYPEIKEAFDSGIPILLEAAEQGGDVAMADLAARLTASVPILAAAEREWSEGTEE